MTEEKYNEIKLLRDKISKLDSKIHTIDRLLEYDDLGMTIEGTSNCKFKIKKFINLSDDKIIKSILEKTKMDLNNQLYLLNEEFSKI